MKIPKDKQNKLIGVAVATLVVICGLWYLLISSQSATLGEVQQKIRAAQDNQQAMSTAVKLADKIHTELDAATEQMNKIEQQMAAGDLYSWMYNLLKEFKTGYRVEIPQFSAVEVSDCTLIPTFPFKQAKMTINGSGYFHEIGRFIADFENQYSYIRLQNLTMSPGGGGQSAGDREKINFRLDVIALVKNTTETK